MSSTSFQMGKTFWGVVSPAEEQSRRNDFQAEFTQTYFKQTLFLSFQKYRGI